LAIFAAYLFEIYNTVPYLKGRPYDPLWSAFWFPLNRALWALILTSIIWLCITNNGGIVGRVLQWRGFKPLSRLTYAVYLTHAWTLWIALGARRDLIDINTRSVIVLCGGILLSAFSVAFVFTVLFEAPLFHILELIKSGRVKGHDDEQSSGMETKAIESVFVVNNGNVDESTAVVHKEEVAYTELVKARNS